MSDPKKPNILDDPRFTEAQDRIQKATARYERAVIRHNAAVKEHKEAREQFDSLVRELTTPIPPTA